MPAVNSPGLPEAPARSLQGSRGHRRGQPRYRVPCRGCRPPDGVMAHADPVSPSSVNVARAREPSKNAAKAKLLPTVGAPEAGSMGGLVEPLRVIVSEPSARRSPDDGLLGGAGTELRTQNRAAERAGRCPPPHPRQGLRVQHPGSPHVASFLFESIEMMSGSSRTTSSAFPTLNSGGWMRLISGLHSISCMEV